MQVNNGMILAQQARAVQLAACRSYACCSLHHSSCCCLWSVQAPTPFFGFYCLPPPTGSRPRKAVARWQGESQGPCMVCRITGMYSERCLQCAWGSPIKWCSARDYPAWHARYGYADIMERGGGGTPVVCVGGHMVRHGVKSWGHAAPTGCG